MEFRFNDTVIHYELEGPSGVPVVAMSHSLAANLELWDLQAQALRSTHRILRFDTRGHGKSSAPPGPYTMEMLAADVIGLLDHLSIERAHFLGISMGGMIGQTIAVRYPDRLDKLVLANTTSHMAPETAPTWQERIRTAKTEGMETLAPEIIDRWLSSEFQRARPDMTERLRNMIIRTPVAGYVGCCQAISNFDISAELNKVIAHTLILAGERDSVLPVSAAEGILRQIKHSELVVLPRAMHLSNLEAADLFNRELLSFLG